jgi:hypothetical protein
MNAALKQICCCPWNGEVRLRDEAECAVHGIDYEAARVRQRKQGELLALQEAMRLQHADAMTALHQYNRSKRRMRELKNELGRDVL